MKWVRGLMIFFLGLALGAAGIYWLWGKYDYVSPQKMTNAAAVDSKVSTKNDQVDNSASVNKKANSLTGTEPNELSLTSKVPILMYHHVKINTQPYNAVEKGLDVPPEMFEKQIEILGKMGYQTVTMSQLESDLETGNIKTRQVAITFDDGYDDVYTNAFPILKKYNMVGTIYLIANDVGKPNYMTVEQIQELKKAGFEIGSHTLSHPDLATAGIANVKKEVQQSKIMLENLFGVTIDSFCYPSGKFNDQVVQMVKQAGYKNAVTTNEGYADINSDFFKLDRIRISGTGTLANFAEKIFTE